MTEPVTPEFRSARYPLSGEGRVTEPVTPEFRSLLAKYGASDRLLGAVDAAPAPLVADRRSPVWRVARLSATMALVLLLCGVVSYALIALRPVPKLSPVAQVGVNTAAALSPDGRSLALVDPGGRVDIFDATSGTRVGRLAVEAVSARFGPDGRRLAVITRSAVQLWDSAPFRLARTLGTTATDVAFSPDGRLLAVVGADQGQIWDLATGTRVGVPITPGFATAAFSPDGRQLAVVGREANGVWIWNVSDPAKPRPRFVDATADQARAVAFSPDGRLLTAVVGNSVRVYNLGDNLPGPPRTTTVEGLPLSWVEFDRDGRNLVVTSDDGVVSIISVDDGAPKDPQRIPGAGRLLTAIGFTGDQVVAVTADGTLLRQDEYRFG